MQGWIKLHRKLIENPIFLKPELLQLFIYCLLKANHEPNKMIFNGKEIIIERGQFVTGRDVLSRELKQNGTTTYKRLKILENLQILNTQSNNRFTLVTIVNYSLYQTMNENSNSQSDNKGTTREQQGNTNKNYKELKELKELKDLRSSENDHEKLFNEFWTAYPRKVGKGEAFAQWEARVKGTAKSDIKTPPEDLLSAAKNYASECSLLETETEYIKHPKTFLSKKRPFEDYVNKVTIAKDKPKDNYRRVD